ncbi:MAG: hypothetical protein J3Q66DRAFT_363772 [Benniella sp.]|nr:MAG: hypothetical protein J3Q66DRAFT_363772 [Benniella sp.]
MAPWISPHAPAVCGSPSAVMWFGLANGIGIEIATEEGSSHLQVLRKKRLEAWTVLDRQIIRVSYEYSPTILRRWSVVVPTEPCKVRWTRREAGSAESSYGSLATARSVQCRIRRRLPWNAGSPL